MLADISVLETSGDAVNLADELVRQKALPQGAIEDALHIAVTAANGIDFPLTWNFRHMANAAMQKRVAQICRDWGLEPPVICSPQALMED